MYLNVAMPITMISARPASVAVSAFESDMAVATSVGTAAIAEPASATVPAATAAALLLMLLNMVFSLRWRLRKAPGRSTPRARERITPSWARPRHAAAA
uniref:Transmembrane protein n=1 Tax=Ralstonia solanacearum TaxID=305 RepID=O82956_RALSL|nr:unnamed protein product [Ralstonia solanacearum]